MPVLSGKAAAGRLSGWTMAHSATADAVLEFLRTIQNSRACEECGAAYLSVDRWAVLKSIRELVVAGRILCTYDQCVICRERRLVARLRYPPAAASSRRWGAMLAPAEVGERLAADSSPPHL